MMTRRMMALRARQAARTRKVCFIHVPKCGGDSVSSALARSYSYWDRMLVPSWYLDLPASRRAAETAGCEMMELRETLLMYKLAEGRAKFISGHIPCRAKTRETFEKQWHFITILRDPVLRWISEFVYNSYGAQEWARNSLSIEDYLESSRGADAGRTYIRYFATSGLDDIVDETHVESAVANLCGFAAVGVLEQLETFAAELARLVGRPVRIPHLNVTPRATAVRDLMSRPDLLQKIRALCRWDIAVYQRFRAMSGQRGESVTVRT